MVLDGWGCAPPGPGQRRRAWRARRSFDRLLAEYPHGTLDASGPAVGLPPGQMGNSEVGHLNIGAGRVVYQDLTRITKAIDDGSFFENRVLKQACAKAGGARAAAAPHGPRLRRRRAQRHGTPRGVPRAGRAARASRDVVVHAFLDGRDTPPQERQGLPGRDRRRSWTDSGVGRFGIVSGRYYAMDRDTRWDRVKLAYDALVLRRRVRAPPTRRRPSTPPTRAARPTSSCSPTVVAPRARRRVRGRRRLPLLQLPPRPRARAHARLHRAGLRPRSTAAPHPPAVDFVTMTEYKKEFPLPVAFPPEHPQHVLADVLAEHGLRQLHIAETEKYAHVTFFFNGGVEKAVDGRGARPRAQPARRAHLRPEAGDERLRGDRRARAPASAADAFDFVVVQLRQRRHGRPHRRARRRPSRRSRRSTPASGASSRRSLRVGGVCLITADHGNSDHMLEPDGSPNTAHSTNPVPFVATVAGRARARGRRPRRPRAHRRWHLLGLAQPPEMTGADLLEPRLTPLAATAPQRRRRTPA